MALSDFFRINLPYGLNKIGEDKWFVFNREYMPLGYNKVTENVIDENSKYATKYKGLTDHQIKKIIKNPKLIQEENGVIKRFFLYNDASNPRLNSNYWDEYLDSLKKLAPFQKTK